ncbi:hypothetical protein JY651_37845 [Pyxidicoccus parkwayensis]|uniref:Uncharacterized protein n=1 Tax=Pyxidicoccus parkwayensis TaxID=2813578 RepID=A0ABX7NQ19_9BACT|nr:hypothetical protein [Pyxidicoccus parkwaysis]QSQ20942.1 hypothetical protein JY651_37845 [Pyxidicoccus parkwaysis]
MKTSHLLLLGLLTGAPALADTPTQYLDLRTPAVALTARVTKEGLSSPELQLGLTENALRGRAFGQPIDVTLKEDHVGGIYRGGPVNLKLTEEGDTLQAKGSFGGQITNFKVSPESITGTVGRCSYQLKAAAEKDRYQGTRSCGFGIENPVNLSIPPAIAADDARLVATLSIVLAQ